MACVAISGNMAEGFVVSGPFATFDDADEVFPCAAWIATVDHKPHWLNNGGQYPRLIDELIAAGALTPQVIQSVCQSMDLTKKELEELLDRASDEWDAIKAAL